MLNETFFIKTLETKNLKYQLDKWVQNVILLSTSKVTKGRIVEAEGAGDGYGVGAREGAEAGARELPKYI